MADGVIAIRVPGAVIQAIGIFFVKWDILIYGAMGRKERRREYRRRDRDEGERLEGESRAG